MADHIFGNKHLNMLAAVMNAEFETDHFRCDLAGSRPGFNDPGLFGFLAGNFFKQPFVHERPLF